MKTALMNIQQNATRKVVKYAPRVSAAVATSFYAFAANAADYTEQLNAAGVEAQTNQSTVVSLVVGIAVIGFGATMFLKWLNK
ncbi:hypothetical protein [Photobacterium alginatilyticum]|uniref:Uncharacterized protein n=1 Tax=Photobacterium alginatilyticum TaxID=1775171 RepID=A0ABW9YR24_9GAMM|nr:hypothetical protein [Photobacterium alginatilyticum]NBI55476.1 hypothetical protein [Photobacterium alginatilyticum]